MEVFANDHTVRLLVSGGAGFIGSGFIRYMMEKYQRVCIFNIDKLTYAGNLDNVASVNSYPNYCFFRGDVCDVEDVESAFVTAEEVFHGPIDIIVHFAAETHVDRSIELPAPFLQTNILGTEILLRLSRAHRVKRFIHVSTDEVYGTLGEKDKPFQETSPLAPNSPYAASKAGSDFIVRAYYETYHFPVIISRCSNNYGPYQYPEKLIPLMITNALDDIPLPIYGDGKNVRDWIYVDDHSQGIDVILRKGKPGEIYNLGGHNEMTNLDVAKKILALIGKSETLIQFVPDRPGHDRRYAMDTTKIENDLGWIPRISFDNGLQKTIEWYTTHGEWLNRVRSGVNRHM